MAVRIDFATPLVWRLHLFVLIDNNDSKSIYQIRMSRQIQFTSLCVIAHEEQSRPWVTRRKPETINFREIK